MSIKFNDVCFTYSPKTPFQFAALKDLNVEIKKGSFTAVVGHTGSGKSTMVQQINGLAIPTSGTIEVEDFVIGPKIKMRNISKLRKLAGMVFQFPEYQLFESTVEKDVSFGPKNFGYSAAESVEKAHIALERVHLDSSFYERSPFELSGGQKRRVAIAGIIASDPEILILDEPTAGLDPRGTEEMMNLFNDIHKQGVTIVLVTHDMDLVLKYADDVIVMSHGEMVRHCSPIELFSNYDESYALEIPEVFKVALMCKEKGLDLDLEQIKDTKTLAKEIARAKKVKYHE